MNREEPRRFRVHHGNKTDGAGYVIVDSWLIGKDWRGKVVFKTDARSEAIKKADELNES